MNSSAPEHRHTCSYHIRLIIAKYMGKSLLVTPDLAEKKFKHAIFKLFSQKNAYLPRCLPKLFLKPIPYPIPYTFIYQILRETPCLSHAHRHPSSPETRFEFSKRLKIAYRERVGCRQTPVWRGRGSNVSVDSHYQGCFSIVFTGHSLK